MTQNLIARLRTGLPVAWGYALCLLPAATLLVIALVTA